MRSVNEATLCTAPGLLHGLVGPVTAESGARPPAVTGCSTAVNIGDVPPSGRAKTAYPPDMRGGVDRASTAEENPC